MYRIELVPGEVTVFRTIEELATGVRNGVITSKARIYHGASDKWLPIEFHPHYKQALELNSGHPTDSTGHKNTAPKQTSPRGSGSKSNERPRKEALTFLNVPLSPVTPLPKRKAPVTDLPYIEDDAPAASTPVAPTLKSSTPAAESPLALPAVQEEIAPAPTAPAPTALAPTAEAATAEAATVEAATAEAATVEAATAQLPSDRSPPDDRAADELRIEHMPEHDALGHPAQPGRSSARNVPVHRPSVDHERIDHSSASDVSIHDTPVLDRSPAYDVPAHHTPVVDHSPVRDLPAHHPPVERTPAHDDAPVRRLPFEPPPVREMPVSSSPARHSPFFDAPLAQGRAEAHAFEEP